MEGDRVWGERVDLRRDGERPSKRRDDDRGRQVVPARERFRNGRRGVPGSSLRKLRQADPGTPEHITRTGTDPSPGVGNQGKGPNVGWEEGASIYGTDRERGEAYANRTRVPLQRERALPRGGHQKHSGDAPENLNALMPATVIRSGNALTRRSTLEWDDRGEGEGEGGEGTTSMTAGELAMIEIFGPDTPESPQREDLS